MEVNVYFNGPSTEIDMGPREFSIIPATGPQGPQGIQGPKGDTGETGPAGPGLPSGGTTGQVIRKASGTNYDTAWESVDSAPTASSGHLVTSGGVKTALEAKLDTANVYNGLDKTASGYALDARQGKALNDALAGKQATLTFDSTPTASSTNPVTSGGVKAALDAKQDTLTFDSTPTASSTNPVTSGGVKTALDAIRSIIAGIETTMNATKSYSSGDLLIVGYTLYKATTAIANGATLTPGTNVTATTVAEQLQYILSTKADVTPHNYLFDGRDLSTVFTSASAFHTALAAEDFSKIRIGDYWPLSLSGTFRDYGAFTVPSGTAYFTDAALTTQGGTTSAKIEGQYESATAVKFKISGSDVYCAIGDCLDYFERTCNNAIVNLEVAGINNYWRYGDSGDLSGNTKPHITFVSRDCLPFAMRMRKANSVWENAEETNPWRGSALFKTLNDPDYGVVKLIAATDVGAYMYAGPNGGGMRAMMEVKASGAATASNWAWADRGKLFLPFESEIWGHGVWGGNASYNLGCNLQFPIFAGTRRHISKGIGNGASRSSWWTASSYSGSATSFCIVGTNGYPSYAYAVGAFGAPVCFVMI